MSLKILGKEKTHNETTETFCQKQDIRGIPDWIMKNYTILNDPRKFLQFKDNTYLFASSCNNSLFLILEKVQEKEFQYVKEEEGTELVEQLVGCCSPEEIREVLDEFVDLKIVAWKEKQEAKQDERSIDHEFLYEKLKELKDFQDKMNDMYVFVEDTRDAVGELIDGFEFYIREQAGQ